MDSDPAAGVATVNPPEAQAAAPVQVPVAAAQPTNGTAAPAVPAAAAVPNRPDFTSAASPFVKAAAKIDKRVKVFLWGDSGSGKTTLALRFPKPVVIDLERGTEHYGESFDFDVLPASTASEVAGAVRWLMTHPHEYRTLVIDPITVYWEALQKEWSDRYLRRNKGGKGYKHEYYDLQAKDWNSIKAEFREVIRNLMALDMNVIVTAREKALYAEGDFMKKIGETFDGEKTLPYLFDTILRMRRSAENKFYCRCLKDRTRKLPQDQEFEAHYETLEKAFGQLQLARRAKPLAMATAAQVEQIRQLATEFGMDEAKIQARIQDYGAETLEDLSDTNAQIIIDKLETARRARGVAPAATETK